MTEKKTYLNAKKEKSKTADELAFEQLSSQLKDDEALSQAQENLEIEADPSEDEYLSGKKSDGKEYDELKSEEKQAAPEESDDSKYMRLAADFQNYKRRTEKEKSDIYAHANERLATDLLEVVDNFERAIAQDKSNKADEKFLEGMEMILKQLLGILDKHGVKEIEAIGADFDPNLHSAVQMTKSEEFESGKVIDVLQKGYVLRDRVIRPATVRVAE